MNNKNKRDLSRDIDWRKTIADTTSLISFSFIVEAPREILIGMTLSQTFHSRLLGMPVDLLIGRPYGVYLDYVRKLAGVSEVKGILNLRRLKRILADTFAFTTVMAPVYALVLLIVGVNFKTGIIAVASAAVYSLFQGAPYGIYSDFIRKIVNKLSKKN